jgi:hypothetical protein
VALAGLSFTVLPGRATGFCRAQRRGEVHTMRVILGLDARRSLLIWP